MKPFVFLFILYIGKAQTKENDSEKKLPTLCHVCKHTVTEFLEELDHTANSRDVLELGQVLQSEQHKKIVYQKSGLRLIEALENTCEKIKDYKVHKDKPNHLRYAKEESSTFTTLKNLKKRGVKVDLGFPDEMWDSPDAEIVELKKQCENILEKYEENLNDWYFNYQENNLFDWFCKDNVLKGKSHVCLEEPKQSDEGTSKEEDENKKNGDHDNEGKREEDNEQTYKNRMKKWKKTKKYNIKKLKKGDEEEKEEEKKKIEKKLKRGKKLLKHHKSNNRDEMSNYVENEKQHSEL